MLKEIINEYLVCPTCLEQQLIFINTQDHLFCKNCSGIYPIIHSCPYMIDVRSLINLDENYLGAWHISQMNGSEAYKAGDRGSLAFTARDDVQQIINLMDLKDKVVLDIGSGSYFEPEYVTKSGAKTVISIDPIEPHKKPNFNYIGAIAEYLPFRDNTFDVITLITSLDHVIDVKNSLAEISRVLKPDGIIYFWGEFSNDPSKFEKESNYQLLPRIKLGTPLSEKEAVERYKNNLNILSTKMKNFENNKKLYSQLLVDEYHLRHFQKETLQQAFSKQGLHLTASNHIYYPSGTYNYFLTFSKIKLNETKNEPVSHTVLLEEDTRHKINTLYQALDDINAMHATLRMHLSRPSLSNYIFQLASYLIKIGKKLRNFFNAKAITWWKSSFQNLYNAKFKSAPNKKPNGKTILMLTVSMIEIDCRINKVAKSLEKNGYEILIFCPELGTQNKNIIEQNISQNIKYIRIQGSALDNTMRMFYQNNYIEASKQYNFDFVHVNDLTTLITGWAISKISGCPLIYDSHELWADNVSYIKGKYVRMSLWKRLLARTVEKRLLKDVASFYSVSPSILTEYEHKYQRRPYLLANYPDITLFENSPTKFTSLKELLNLTPDHFVTLYIGGVGPSRNIEKVIKAHQYLDDKFIFVIRGPGIEQYGPIYKALAKSLNIENKIFILPAVNRDEVIAASNGADCGIVMLENLCKNFYWYYPNKFFEYSLAGLPVAASNFPDIEGHIRKENVGITFDPHDPKSIAAALSKLYENRAETRAMGRRGRESIYREYNWDSAINVMVNEYERLSTQ